MPAITLLSQLNQQSISEQVKLLPQRYTASDRIKDFARDKSLSLIANINKEPEAWLLKLDLPFKLAKVNDTDGFRMTFTDGEVVHLRPSGNAPELRCYAESNSQIKAEQLVKATLSAIQNL